MSVYTSIYWKMPVLSQKIMGVWPYDEKTIYNRIMPIVVYISLYALMIPMGIRLFKELGVNNIIALENVMGEMYLHGAVIKLTTTVVYKKKLKAVYDLIANDWEMTRDEKELKIMEDHARLGRNLSIFYLITCCFTAGAFLLIPTCKPFLNYIAPLENDSRPWILPYYVEYYIDQDKYYIPIIIQGFISGIWSITVFITYDMSFAMCVQHVCSLFDIIRALSILLFSLRLHRASELSSQPSARFDYTQADYQVFKHITLAMELHQIVITNINILEDAYNICWFPILLLNTVGLGGVLVVVLEKKDEFSELVRYGMCFLIVFVHKYYIFLPGQKIIDNSLLVMDECYSCDWYQMSPRCKKLIKMMMLRSIRPLELTGGKMFVLCMATYAAMLKAGMSYFTMLANTR